MSKILVKIRKLGRLGRTANKIIIVSAVILAIAVLLVVQINAYTDRLNNGLSDNLIRLHVIANSDSPEDQALKRDVRDAVLSYMQRELKNSNDVEQTSSIINSKLNEITAIAKDEISRRDMEYNANSTLGNYPFPTKAYGDITLPAGSYQALRIVIGKGEGANWWCVLFPPLCFVDVTHGTVPDTVKENLKEALTEEEYSIVTSADEDSDIPIKIKFKIVELFQDSKIRFAGAISKIFRNPG